eukprot:COSAG02_NODE_783_length_17238_cov_173.774199_2_plen_1914_part_00
MEEGTPPILAELQGLPLGQLLQKAEFLGADEEALDGAESKLAVIALIVAKVEEQAAAEEHATRRARLTKELGSMTLRALHRKALQLGADKQQMDEAEDKEALIALILELPLANMRVSAEEPQPEPEDQPEPDDGDMTRTTSEPHPPYRPLDISHPFRSCLDRAYVQKEIRWAKQYKKKIITVFEKEHHRPGFFDYSVAAEKYSGTEWEFILGIDAIPYQRDQFLADAMMANILAKATTTDVRAADNPINPPGVWEFFLSHHQALGGDQMKTLSLLFERSKKTVWYDNGQLDKSEKAMEEGVKHCKNFVLLLTAEAVTAAPRQSLSVAPEPADQHQPMSPTLPVFIAHRGSSADVVCAELLQEHLPGASVGPASDIPDDAQVIVSLLCHDEATFEQIRLDSDSMRQALAAVFRRKQVVLPIVDSSFSTEMLEGLPDDIRSLGRQLFVPVDWQNIDQGVRTLRDCIEQVRKTDIPPVLREYLETVIKHTETFKDPCTQEVIHTETQCVPLKLLKHRELEESRKHSSKQIDETDRMLMRRRLGLGGTIGYGSELLSQSFHSVREAEVHFQDARDGHDGVAMMIVSVIVGPAACGKTTLLNRIACGYAKDALCGCPGAMVPYVIRVMAFSRWLNSKTPNTASFKEYILAAQCAGDADCELYSKLIDLFDTGRLVLIFDGIDEAGTTLDEITKFLSVGLGGSYAGRMIMSSRESLFDEALFTGSRFQMLQIQPLTEAMQDDVLRRRFKDSTDVASFKEQQSISENLKEMGTNPMLLTLQIGVFLLERKQLPERRTELYDKGVRLLLRRVETTNRSGQKAGVRSVKDTVAAVKRPPNKRPTKLDRDVEALMTVLCQTGHLLHVTENTRDFAAGTVYAMLENDDTDLADLPRDAAMDAWKDLLQDGRGIIMCVQQDPSDSMNDTWRSTHLTLQEFFAAKQCVVNARASGSSDDLIQHFDTVFGLSPSPWLREVLLMVAEMLLPEEFQMLAEHYIDMDDGTGAASILVTTMLKCRREDTRTGVGAHLQQRLRTTRPFEQMAVALCHPSEALRTQGLTEITEFGMSKEAVASKLVLMISADASEETPWYVQLNGIQSLGKLGVTDSCVRNALLGIAFAMTTSTILRRESLRALKTLKMENSMEVAEGVIHLLQACEESRSYGWQVVTSLQIDNDLVLNAIWEYMRLRTKPLEYLVSRRPSWLVPRLTVAAFDCSATVQWRSQALLTLKRFNVTSYESVVPHVVKMLGGDTSSTAIAWKGIKALELSHDDVLGAVWKLMHDDTDALIYLIRRRPAWLHQNLYDWQAARSDTKPLDTAIVTLLSSVDYEAKSSAWLVVQRLRIQTDAVVKALRNYLGDNREVSAYLMDLFPSHSESQLNCKPAPSSVLDPRIHEPGSEPLLESEQEPNSSLMRQLELESEAEPESGPEPGTEPKPEPEPEPGHEPHPERELEPEPEPEPEPGHEHETRPQDIWMPNQDLRASSEIYEVETPPEEALKALLSVLCEPGISLREVCKAIEGIREIFHAIVPRLMAPARELFEEKRFAQFLCSLVKQDDEHTVQSVFWAVHRAASMMTAGSVAVTKVAFLAYQYVQQFDDMLRQEDEKYNHTLLCTIGLSSSVVLQSTYMEALIDQLHSAESRSFAFAPLLYHIRNVLRSDPVGKQSEQLRSWLGEKLKSIEGIESLFLRKELTVGKFEHPVPFWRGEIPISYLDNEELRAKFTAGMYSKTTDGVVGVVIQDAASVGTHADRVQLRQADGLATVFTAIDTLLECTEADVAVYTAQLARWAKLRNHFNQFRHAQTFSGEVGVVIEDAPADGTRANQVQLRLADGLATMYAKIDALVECSEADVVEFNAAPWVTKNARYHELRAKFKVGTYVKTTEGATGVVVRLDMTTLNVDQWVAYVMLPNGATSRQHVDKLRATVH